MIDVLEKKLDGVTPEFRVAYELIRAQGDAAFDWRMFQVWVEDRLAVHAGLVVPRTIFQPMPNGAAPVSVVMAAEVVDERVLATLITLARQEVLVTLAGFVRTPSRDGFVQGLIYRRLVVRQSGREQNQWVARANARSPLSDILLALFAVDVLTQRDRYDRLFRVCRTCGEMAFDGEHPRDLCPEHASRSRAATVRTGKTEGLPNGER